QQLTNPHPHRENTTEGVIMWMWSRSVSLLRAPLRHSLIPRAQISVKPAKHDISVGETCFVMAVMFATILGPSGWVLANLENYKKRP
ncbi:hypothetical protein NFI96_010478, partial [Prochilodus magdalenae]